ncbi:hypothetical protein [Xanthomonas vasicola]|uniref:hypothetical protein n=1 Tax=Xanthomonas vasicola TaxID=56459 RepID=UPI000F6310DE|nr:hypothetical protein [Xanthomonas vasicola]AZR30936.1 hypothetical protein KWO_010750 [Xanthomonas vasicola pv. musacearum NCPPB 4379]MBV7278014.1 hypothetical protein [Xanthomonas vasicola pv. musacearum]RRJ41634.1 hypothetical protein EIM46_07345 [Xanthomonas vasicola pv. musacearum]
MRIIDATRRHANARCWYRARQRGHALRRGVDHNTHQAAVICKGINRRNITLFITHKLAASGHVSPLPQ